MGLREYVYAAVVDDAELLSLGLNADTVSANGAPVSPQTDRFAVLRWGPETPGLPGQRGANRMSEREVSLWVYDRNPDYANINLALKRWCVLMDGTSGANTGGGWITCCEWNGDSDDGWDDVYERIVRSSTYTIIASGK